jgi:glycosyltransferase involved in cell wall biosynthesis
VLPAVVRNIPEHAPAIQRGNALRHRLGVDGDARLLLYQGLIAESRCLLELIDAVAMLGMEVRLVLIGEGDGEYERRVAERMEALGGRGHRIGWTAPDELARLTASADLGVLLYRNNGRNNFYAAPNKLYEYIFAGLPVLASAFPGLVGVVEQGGYGVCANPHLPEDIARAISAALNIPAGDAIAMRAREQFRWESEADVLRRVYREALAGRRRG